MARRELKVDKKAGILRVLTGPMSNGAYMAEVDLTTLHFADYQRDEILPHTKRIADGWEDRFARPLSISYRDGILWVMDGRQTSSAALRKKKAKMTHEAIVWIGLTP